MATPLKQQDITDILASPIDKDDVCRAAFDRITRSYLRRLVSEDLIEEHRRRPSGRHSEALGRNGPIDWVGDEVFATVEAGYDGIFLLKLKDMMEADNG